MNGTIAALGIKPGDIVEVPIIRSDPTFGPRPTGEFQMVTYIGPTDFGQNFFSPPLKGKIGQIFDYHTRASRIPEPGQVVQEGQVLGSPINPYYSAFQRKES